MSGRRFRRYAKGAKHMTTQQYHIDGMTCAACSSAVERVTRKLDGVERSDVNLTTGRMTITYDEDRVTPELIQDRVSKAGFSASLVEETGERESRAPGRRAGRGETPGDHGGPLCPAPALYFHGAHGSLSPAPSVSDRHV